MIVRHWIGDLSLAVLLALPLTVLAAPDAVPHKPTATTSATSFAPGPPPSASGRVGLLG
jgi:hypothetical protein